MPGIASAAARNDHQIANGTASFSTRNGFWSKHREDVSYNQLQKFWSELSPQARQELLRIDKQTLFEQARKNMYCSRCNGLLLEGFLQIVMYGKSLQQEGTDGHHLCNRLGVLKDENDGDFSGTGGCEDIQDPSVHPWGGLTTTREGTLTLLDCYLYAKSLKGVQNVFDSARARERERELLYPDACGGGGRGWISQGMAIYGRGHGTRETCALHTARLSVDTLVDFWSALGEETRLSLLRMKEDDFIERLMFRFDSKRFCRDCRRNVIREFKELKELKRMKREPRCTSWFCVADTAFQYEVSHDTVQADWHQTFVETFGTYHHFEWAVGTGEGKSDILEFENVGLSGRVQVKGLDLSGLNSCYITLRAWKMDGRCTELSVKAYALKGQQCVHCRLVVGDGFVTITRGESIRRFFEHAEEAEEEEDDDSMDKDGNELDGECSRPQKHAKSPELAREFLLDAATVIFKEQVEKAFREGTARQNAHSIFVCLALKLLEDRVHVACKEIITLEKQMKLLEEEEKEKREEEERKERRRTKEREKKLRRKERLREKEKDREKKCSESNQHSVVPEISEQELTTIADDESNVTSNGDFVSKTGEPIPSRSLSPDIQDEKLLDEFIPSDMPNHCDSPDGEFSNTNDGTSPFPIDHLKYSRRNLKFRKEFQHDAYSKWFDRRRYAIASENSNLVSKYEPRHHSDNHESAKSVNRSTKQLRIISSKSNIRNFGPKYGEKFPCSGSRIHDRHDSHACSCNQYNDYRSKVDSHMCRVVREHKSVFKSESASDMSKAYHRINHNQVEYTRENFARSKNKTLNSINAYHRDSTVTKKVWEPMESQKKYPRSNSDSDVTLGCSAFKGEVTESGQVPEKSIVSSSDEVSGISTEINLEDKDFQEVRMSEPEKEGNIQDRLCLKEKSHQYKEAADEEGELCPISRSLHGTLDLSMSCSSNSDNCSSCLSEGDSNASSSNPQNTESSSSSDSEDASQNSEGRETSVCLQNGFTVCQEAGLVQGETMDKGEHVKSQTVNGAGTNTQGTLPSKIAPNSESGRANVSINAQPQVLQPQMHNQSIQFPIFQSPPMGYYHQSPLSWPAAPTNGFVAFPHPNHYVFANSFGYGLNGNAHFMQYGALQRPTPPVLNHNHVPIFQSVAQNNSIKDQVKIANLGGINDAHAGANVQRVVATGLQSMETLKTAENGKNAKSDKSDVGNTGFSLFHFGGPVDLSNGLKSESVSLKEEIGGDLSFKLSADHNEGDQTCNNKNSVEEYNLFAASNGIKFSFF
ncbi:hypothetical protein ACH5RR_007495 [Cinchona calisaya]|uniref:Uncharacterized protein n=1 Tax=Cinchona calisaya TaxID=153742 RepID=A0ABD3ASG8_9GENT